MTARAIWAFVATTVAFAAFMSDERSVVGAQRGQPAPTRPPTAAELAGEWGTADGTVRLTLEVRESRLFLTLDSASEQVRAPLARAELKGATFRTGSHTLAFTGPNNGTLTSGTAAPVALIRRASLTLSALAGKYTREKPTNDSHFGTIEVRPGILGFEPRVRWVNKAGLAWQLSLDLDKKLLLTGEDCPHFKTNPTDGRSFRVTQVASVDGVPQREVEGFHFLGEFYWKRRMADTGSALTEAEARELVNYHNTVRKDVGVGPVKWKPELAKFAQAWADEIARTGDVKHRPNGSGPWQQKYGENIARGTDPFGPLDAAKLWQGEISFYTPGTPFPVDFAGFKAGHYTQMVWKATTEIGAGKAVIQVGPFKGQAIHVCNYNPLGNILGQKPY